MVRSFKKIFDIIQAELSRWIPQKSIKAVVTSTKNWRTRTEATEATLPNALTVASLWNNCHSAVALCFEQVKPAWEKSEEKLFTKWLREKVEVETKSNVGNSENAFENWNLLIFIVFLAVFN